MFLPSTTEVGLANENNIAEGTLLALFSNDASRVAYPTAQCVSNSEYTNSNFSTSKGWYWWLRTPYSSYARSVRCVDSGGSLNSYNACGGYGGVRPLCNLKSSILVSDSPNSDGNYTVIYNSAPSAPPSITAPATCYSGQNINISCAAATDPDGDALTYVSSAHTTAARGHRFKRPQAGVHGSGIDRVEHVKIPRPRKGQLRQLFRVHHKRRYCRNS